VHQTSGRWKLGLFLAFMAAFMWGLLPIALKGLLSYMDSITITWYRFLIALIVIFPYLKLKNKLPKLQVINRKFVLVLLFVSMVALLGNYVLYMLGLEYSTAEGAQLMIQLAPMLLLLGSLWLFKEDFNRWQVAGLVSFIAGLILFFNHRLNELTTTTSDYGYGIFLVFLAAIIWAFYALAQKQLLKYLSSMQIMIIIFLFCTLVLLPFSVPSLVIELDLLGWLLLLFCGANTIIAYGAFAESLEHWEASRVSAVLAVTPLITLLAVYTTSYYFPHYIQVEALNTLSIIGAILVVVGSACTALVRTKKKS
jgi:drug/metabolite transporter (DMT)-like permease